MSSLAERVIDTKLFGELHVLIHQVKVCPRYPNELLRVKWSVGEFSNPEVWSEFVVKYDDPVLISKGVHPVYDAREMDVSRTHQKQVAEAIMPQLRFEENMSLGCDWKVEVFFEAAKNSHRLSATVIWATGLKFST